MTMPFVYKLNNNAADVLKATAEQKLRALEAGGIQAEGDVKDEITDLDAVDTGRLRGSIAHQVDGDSVEVGTNVDYAVYVHEGTGKYAIGGSALNASRCSFSASVVSTCISTMESTCSSVSPIALRAFLVSAMMIYSFSFFADLNRRRNAQGTLGLPRRVDRRVPHGLPAATTAFPEKCD